VKNRFPGSIPEVFLLATDRDATKICDDHVVQHFIPNGTIGIGFIQGKSLDEDGSRIFDKERLLIETVRTTSA